MKSAGNMGMWKKGYLNQKNNLYQFKRNFITQTWQTF